MTPVTIRKTIEIAAPPAQVWPRIGTAAGLSQWWGVDIEMEEREGGHFAESGLYNSRPYRQIGEVITYDPPCQLIIRLHNLGAGIEWPIHTEVDITLEEISGAENEPRTRVSIVHQAFTDEADAVATVDLMSIDPNAATYGPTMVLPQNAGTAKAASSVTDGQAVTTATITLHHLYQWRSQQEESWALRCAQLISSVD